MITMKPQKSRAVPERSPVRIRVRGFSKMSEKIDLTEDYNLAKDVISKLGFLIARGFVDIEWIIEEAKKNAKNQAREIKRKRVPIRKN